MDYNSIKSFAQDIINTSIEEFSQVKSNSLEINKKIFDYENNTFNLNEETKNLLDNQINYDGFLPLIKDNSPQNLLWLKSLKLQKSANRPLKFPVKQLVLVEGITEETLLPTFAEKCNINFDSRGIHIISAGGKNQVVKLFYRYVEQVKIPIFVLLDNDAKENYEQIKCRLRDSDKIYMLKSGEFEDILPKSLIKRTLNDYFINLNSISDEEFTDEHMVVNLEEIFKKKGFHEFKKAEFAQLIKNQVKSDEDISEEIRNIICGITSLIQ